MHNTKKYTNSITLIYMIYKLTTTHAHTYTYWYAHITSQRRTINLLPTSQHHEIDEIYITTQDSNTCNYSQPPLRFQTALSTTH
jgi:hypothetical protein